MSLDTLSQVLAAAACVVILWRTEPALNRMGRRRGSPPLLVAAFFGLAVAAATALGAMLFGSVPPWPATLGAVAVATLLVCERRMRAVTWHPSHRGARHDPA